MGFDAFSCMWANSGYIRHNYRETKTGEVPQWTVGDILRIVYDSRKGAVTFWKNGKVAGQREGLPEWDAAQFAAVAYGDVLELRILDGVGAMPTASRGAASPRMAGPPRQPLSQPGSPGSLADHLAKIKTRKSHGRPQQDFAGRAGRARLGGQAGGA